MLLLIPVFYFKLNHEFPALQLQFHQDNRDDEIQIDRFDRCPVEKEKTTHSKLNIYLFEPG